jgi:type I restriction enzyme S subunit
MKKGWQTKTIGDVCEFQRGLTYAKGDEVDVSDNIVLRATNIDLATNLLIFDELKYISDKVRVPESKKVKKGSLMICMASGSKSHLGKVAFIDDDYGYAFGGFMGMLTPLNGLLPKYLFHLMTSEDYKDFIGALSDGANINNLTFDKLKVFPVPVPPLAEQQRIVGLLDEAFEGLATAKANAEKNLQNARALFESHLQSVFTQRGPGWVNTRLADICERVSVGHVGPTSEFYCDPSEGIPFLRSQNVRPGKLDWEGVQYITKEFHARLRKSQIRFGDLLFVRVGANRGDCCAVLEDVAELNCANIVFARPTRGNAAYLERYCQSPPGRAQLLGMTTGSAQGVINTKSVAELVVPMPRPSEQEKVVNKLDDLHDETQRLARLYERKHAALEALKKSLLHQAFTGALE